MNSFTMIGLPAIKVSNNSSGGEMVCLLAGHLRYVVAHRREFERLRSQWLGGICADSISILQPAAELG